MGVQQLPQGQAGLVRLLQRVKEESPLVHNITNAVVMNNTANALLAAGASPIMAHALEEIDEMVALCRATVINIGTLDRFTVESMKAAIRRANEVGHPVVLDPVGAGATSFRNQTLRDILAAGTPTFIRGNASEIMTMAEQVITENIPHGKICIGFTPDEEVGRGADFFDVEDFGADFAYTVDGGAENEIEYENFNAAGAKVKIKGFSVHPGSSKNTMINAALVAMEFNNMLPAGDTPANTEEYEGFFHLCEMSGDVSSASLDYIIRDHDSAMFACRQELMRHIVKLLNEKYGEGTVTLIIKEQYRNMKEKIEPCMHLIDNAKKAVQQSGLNPKTVAIRGGTDGARLSFMGLPCPNLGTGGYAFHGPCEHITVEGMDYAVENLKNIVKLYAC